MRHKFVYLLVCLYGNAVLTGIPIITKFDTHIVAMSEKAIGYNRSRLDTTSTLLEIL